VELWSARSSRTNLAGIEGGVVAALTAGILAAVLFFVGLVSGALVIAGMSGSDRTSEFMASLSAAKPGGDSYKALMRAYETFPPGPARITLLAKTHLLAGDCEQAVFTFLNWGDLARATELSASCTEAADGVANLSSWALLLRGDVAGAAAVQSKIDSNKPPVLRHLLVSKRWKDASMNLHELDASARECLHSWLRAREEGTKLVESCAQPVLEGQSAASRTETLMKALTGPVKAFKFSPALFLPPTEAHEVLRIALQPASSLPGRSSAALAALHEYLQGADASPELLPAGKYRSSCRRGEWTVGASNGWLDAALRRTCEKKDAHKVERHLLFTDFEVLDALTIAAPFLGESEHAPRIAAEIGVPTPRGRPELNAVDTALAVALKLGWTYRLLGDNDRSQRWLSRATRLATALTDPEVIEALSLLPE
jgi:hypothetical protein